MHTSRLILLLLTLPLLAEAQDNADTQTWDTYQDIVVKYAQHHIIACHIDLYERTEDDSLQFKERETSIYRSPEDSSVCIIDPHFDRSVYYKFNDRGELMVRSRRKIGYQDSTVAHYYTLDTSNDLLVVRRQRGDTLGSCLNYEDSIYYDTAGNKIRHYFNRGHGCLGGLVRTFTYDDQNRMLSKTDHQDDHSVCYQYDSLGRIHREWVGYHYDGVHPRQMVDLTSHLYNYNADGQLIKETVTGYAEERVYHYAYDTSDRLTSKKAYTHVEELVTTEEWDYHPSDASYRYREYRGKDLYRIVYYDANQMPSKIEHYYDDKVVRAWWFVYVYMPATGER
jgi:YD repeat-containing protein